MLNNGRLGLLMVGLMAFTWPTAAWGQNKAELKPSPAAVVQRQVDAYNAHDLPAFVSCYSDNAQTIDFGSSSVLEKNRSELEKGFADFFKQFPSVKCTIESRIVEGSYVIDKELIEGMNGNKISGTVMYLVSDGKITKVWFLTPPR